LQSRIDILGGKPVMLADVGAENRKAANSWRPQVWEGLRPRRGVILRATFMPLSKRSPSPLKKEPLAVEPFALCAGAMEASLDPFPDHGAFE
jgi:hypothetical protein